MDDNKPYFEHPDWPVKAYNNTDFLNCSAARNIRIQCELTEPQYRLRMMGVRNTIVFFGSARPPEPKVAQANLDAIKDKLSESDGTDEELKASLEAAEGKLRLSKYYEAARELARSLTQWSVTIEEPRDRFLICSGGGPGIMEAANRGASEAGGRSVGLGISLPFEQKNNPYITRELDFEFHYFFIRKYWFLYLAKCMVVFPGGFGTMDELFEMLTLLQTRKTIKYLPVVLFGSEFWSEIINFEAMKKWGVISPRDLELFRIMDSVEEAHKYIVGEMTENYVKRS